jgi:hypothetical protein
MISQAEAQKIIHNLDTDAIVRSVTRENPEMSGFERAAYLDLRDGTILHTTLSQGSYFVADVFVKIYGQNGNFLGTLHDDDIAGADEIPEGGIRFFEDFEERLINAAIFFADECGDLKDEVRIRLNEWYRNREGSTEDTQQ